MLTIFTSPKPFRGHINTIQTNAIRSWAALEPASEIILFGKDEGTAEAAAAFGARHLPDVACNEYGTPLISAMFQSAQEIAQNRLVGYVNADIIFTGDFMPALKLMQLPKFLLVGRRWDTDVKEALDFKKPGWEKDITRLLEASGRLHPPTGIDYFIFPRGQYRDIPPFAVGRAGWDNWMIYHTRAMKIPVIDGTGAITAVHQNHDYAHHPAGKTGVWQGDEARQNRSFIGSYNRLYDIRDATRKLGKDKVRRVPPWRIPCRRGLRMLWSLARFVKRVKPL